MSEVRYPDGSFRGPSVCPTCGASTNAHASLDGDRPPVAGDVSVCGECGAVSIYTGAFSRRTPTSVELVALLAEPMVRTAVAACYAGEWRKG